MAFKKRFDSFRPGVMHFLQTVNEAVATQAWVDKSVTGYTANIQATLEHPIAYFKTLADEKAHGSTAGSEGNDAYYNTRITVKIGTLDEKLVGNGWTAIAGEGAWIKTLYLEEGDIIEGYFDYVEYQDDPSTSDAECGELLCYEHVY